MPQKQTKNDEVASWICVLTGSALQSKHHAADKEANLTFAKSQRLRVETGLQTTLDFTSAQPKRGILLMEIPLKGFGCGLMR